MKNKKLKMKKNDGVLFCYGKMVNWIFFHFYFFIFHFLVFIFYFLFFIFYFLFFFLKCTFKYVFMGVSKW